MALSQPLPFRSKTCKADAEEVSPKKLAGSWTLHGKTERRNQAGLLDMDTKEPVLKFGSTILYLSKEPVSCDESFGETRYSFEVTDAASISETDNSADSETLDFSMDGNNYAEEFPGAFDVRLKADGKIEGDVMAPAAAATDDMCYKFTGLRADGPSQGSKFGTPSQ